MAVHLHGHRAGKWTDFAQAGQESHGDLIDVIELQGRVPKGEAIKRAKEWLGLPERTPVPSQPIKKPVQSGTSSTENARKLFQRAGPIEGTIAEDYLRSRKITEFGPALRFLATTYYREHSNAPTQKLPALLCSITDNAGEIVGCNRIYLSNDGKIAKVPDPKKVLGRLHGCAVRFGAPGDVLIVGEGVETMLSIKTALPHMPVAAALTAVHLANFIPPKAVRSLWIARDVGVAGEQAADELQKRMEHERPDLHVDQLKPRKDDFNTRLAQMGSRRLARRLRDVMGPAAEAILPDTLDGLTKH